MPESSHAVGAYIVAVLTLGVGAQWLAWRIRIPAIVLLAITGLIAGPLTQSVNPSAIFGETLDPVVGLCVAIILFEGGLSLNLRELRVAGSGVRRLILRGVPLTWLLAALAGYYVAGLSWPVALVFGAIMTVTGPTVIMPMLRQAGLNRRTASYLKWEGIVNDPVGVMLAVLTLQFLVHGESEDAGLLTLSLLRAVVAGGAGALVGWLMARAFRGGAVPEYLKAPMMLMTVFLAYEAGNLLQAEAGLLSVTAMGMVVGNMQLASIQDMRRFKEHVSVILVGIVFVLLTADISRETLASLDLRAALLVACVLFVVRPVATMLATVGAGMPMRERLFLAWIAPRGIVAAATAGVMGPSLATAGYPGAESLLALVFAVIFATVVVHGATVEWLARRLDLRSTEAGALLIVGATPWSVALARKLGELDIPVVMADASWRSLSRARMQGVRVYYGEVLSETVAESLEIAHVDTVLAATGNDMYNALVCTAMATPVGSQRVFQLSMEQVTDEPHQLARPLRGAAAFHPDATWERLWRLHVEGWRFGSVTLTEQYDLARYLRDQSDEAITILVRSAGGRVSLWGADGGSDPGPGDTIVYFSPASDAPVDPESPVKRQTNAGGGAAADGAGSEGASPPAGTADGTTHPDERTN